MALKTPRPHPQILLPRRNRTEVDVMSRRTLVLFAIAATVLQAGSAPPSHIKNFGEVNAQIYRGAQPSLMGLQELRASGVRLVIDLREPGTATAREKTAVQALGMQYVNVPFSPWSAPRASQVEAVLTLLSASNLEPAFVHCRRGKDRTGTVIACYRIRHDHWDTRRALTEAHDYGMSSKERGMRSFILHFKELTIFPLSIPPV